jgi:inner membrane protein
VEAEEGFYVGLYSLLDSDTRIAFRYVAKNHDLLGNAADSEAMQTLKWFSRGYFTVSLASDGTLRVHDLRFPRSDLGLTNRGEYIFTFELRREEGGAVTGIRQVSPSLRGSRRLVRLLVRRILGVEETGAAASGVSASTEPYGEGHPCHPPGNWSRYCSRHI